MNRRLSGLLVAFGVILASNAAFAQSTPAAQRPPRGPGDRVRAEAPQPAAEGIHWDRPLKSVPIVAMAIPGRKTAELFNPDRPTQMMIDLDLPLKD
jgi:hypothetical protein